MNTVEIFRTNVADQETAFRMRGILAGHLPDCRINFDLQDRDRILRIEGMSFTIENVCEVMTGHGFHCTLLP